MSLFKRERVFASVELDRVALVRLGADKSAREQTVLPLAADPDHPEAAVQALGTTLASPAWRGAPRRIVLSDRLVRYLVMEHVHRVSVHDTPPWAGVRRQTRRFSGRSVIALPKPSVSR